MATGHPRRWSGLALFSLLLHAVWLTFFGWIACAIWIRGEPGPPEAADAITVAAQMGRLDLIALALTILSVVLALSAIGGFFLLRSAVINAAHDEVAEQMTKRGEDWVATAVDEHMRKKGDGLIGNWLENNPGELRGAIDLALAANEPNLDTEEMIRRMDENDDDDDENVGGSD